MQTLTELEIEQIRSEGRREAIESVKAYALPGITSDFLRVVCITEEMLEGIAEGREP